MCQWNKDHKMWGAVPMLAKGFCLYVFPFEKSVPLWTDTSVEEAISGIIQADISHTVQVFKVLRLNVCIPGKFRVPPSGLRHPIFPPQINLDDQISFFYILEMTFLNIDQLYPHT